MSETPTNPYAAPAMTYTPNVERSVGNPDTWIHPELQARYDSGETFDLEANDLPNEKLWTDEEPTNPVGVIEQFELSELTRAQEVEMMFHGKTDEELLSHFSAVTKTIGTLAKIR